MKLIIIWLLAVNLAGLILMGADKKRARQNRWRIRESTLLTVALLGGSAGVFAGMYLFRHKTKHAKFVIGVPLILILQLAGLLYLRNHWQNGASQPAAILRQQLDQIRHPDEASVDQLLGPLLREETASFETDTSSRDSSDSGSASSQDALQVVRLFYQDFDYHILSSTLSDRQAIITVRLTTIDAKALGTDLCLELTRKRVSSSPLTEGDLLSLLLSTLQQHTYSTVEQDTDFYLDKTSEGWALADDDAFLEAVTGGLRAQIHDPYLLSPEQVLQIYLDFYRSMSPKRWQEEFGTSDLFSTSSSEYAQALDSAYYGKLSQLFDFRIDSCQTEKDTATASVTVTSIDMPYVMEHYRDRLIAYAGTVESITDDQVALSDTAADYLIECLREYARPLEIPVDIPLHNDGQAWYPEITEEVTNAFMGDISGGLAKLAG